MRRKTFKHARAILRIGPFQEDNLSMYGCQTAVEVLHVGTSDTSLDILNFKYFYRQPKLAEAVNHHKHS